jgi:hypothetical protein
MKSNSVRNEIGRAMDGTTNPRFSHLINKGGGRLTKVRVQRWNFNNPGLRTNGSFPRDIFGSARVQLDPLSMTDLPAVHPTKDRPVELYASICCLHTVADVWHT